MDPLAWIWNHPEGNQVAEPMDACSFPALDAVISDVSLTTNLNVFVCLTKEFLATKTEPWLSLKWAPLADRKQGINFIYILSSGD